jgi:hypothetical protein
MRKFLYYSCPRDGSVVLQQGKVYGHALCDAGCGKLLVFLMDCDTTVPKVCYECTEWVENTMGRA